jgi:hypothetical protein
VNPAGPTNSSRTRGAERLHTAALSLCVAACVFFAVRGAWKSVQGTGSDFAIYYRAGEAVLARSDPTAVPGFIYLPVFAVAMAPLAALPFSVAVCVWQALSLAATLWAARRCAQLATPVGERVAPLLWWLPLACTLRLNDSNLSYGQVNSLTFAIVLEGFVALRRARDGRGALWFGLGAAVKLLPGVALIWCALRRSWRAALIGATAFVALALLAPTAAIGPRASIDSLAHWWSHTAQPYERGGGELLSAREYLPGQSLTAAGYRLLCASPATSHGAQGPRANWLELEPDAAGLWVELAIAVQLAVFAATVWMRRAERTSRDFAVEAALALVTVLLVAPLVHKAHMLWIMLAYAALFGAARPDMPRAALLARNAFIALSIGAVSLTAPALTGGPTAVGLLAHNAITLGVEALCVALLIERWATRRSNDARISPRDLRS